MTSMTNDRFEVSRPVMFDAATVFRLLCDPGGHVAIDSSGMLQDHTGEPVTAIGDSFVIHMDRESLGDFPLGRYDVTVPITVFEPDREIAWKILGQVRPPVGHTFGYRLEPTHTPEGAATLVTSYYDWTGIHPEWRAKNIFPILSELNLKATLGILERTLRARA
ncbi:MAG: polyketide cyclase [Sporichthyaceae bacterium]